MRGHSLDKLHSQVGLEAKSAGLALKPQKAEIRADVLSHFILRVAFCRSNRQWWINQEANLLQYDKLLIVSIRLMGTGSIASLLEQDEFKGMAEPLSSEEQEEIAADLEFYDVSKKVDVAARSDTRKLFFKVPFEKALSLVGSRTVMVHKVRSPLTKQGYAIVPEANLLEIIKSRFKERLVEQAGALSLAWETIEERFGRIVPWVKTLTDAGQDESFKAFSNTGSVKITDIEPVDLHLIRSCPKRASLCA